jgi:hypothetical protein
VTFEIGTVNVGTVNVEVAFDHFSIFKVEKKERKKEKRQRIFVPREQGVYTGTNSLSGNDSHCFPSCFAVFPTPLLTDLAPCTGTA